MTSKSIPVVLPHIGKEELNAAMEALNLKWLGMGHYVKTLEDELERYLGVEPDQHVVLLSTGTAAIHAGLTLAGVGPGDEVILPSINFVGGPQMVVAMGASPVFCDIEAETLCLDVQKASRLVTERTKAILPVDYSGHLCRHSALRELASEKGIRVIHDAAHSFGSNEGEKKLGPASDFCVFSFDAIKTLTCIDAGALIVRGKENWERAKAFRLCGMKKESENLYQNKKRGATQVTELGFRYHVPNLHAAIGLEQLKKLPKLIERRQELARNYDQAFGEVKRIQTPKGDWNHICPFLYYLRIQDGRRDDLIEALKQDGIETGIHWAPNHHLELFCNTKTSSMEVTEQVAKEIITIPFYPDLSNSDQEEVIRSIVDFIGTAP